MKNFKVRCIESQSSSFKEGRIYEVKDGFLYSDDGIFRKGLIFTSVEEINEMLCSQFELYESTPYITKVIFNDLATIVLWSDGTKTIVKCGEHDKFDSEKGLAIAKKALGNKGNYYEVFKKWLPDGQLSELKEEA